MNLRLVAFLCFVAAVCLYIACIVTFLVFKDTTRGIIWMGLGSSMLCLGAAVTSRANQNQDK